ncbi:MAG TPA: histidine phosphatase family protein, partial [Flavobacterium sp.]|nr:histidine phosphatase family protein [Flavobacterium sp.]
ELAVLKNQLPNDFDQVFSSPLLRCKTLAETFSSTILFDDRLKEMNFGDWELKAWNDIPTEEIQPWYNDFVTTKAPNGDSFESLYLRCAHFFDELRTKNYKKVLIITHGGFIRSTWSYLLEIPLKNTFKISLDFGEILHFNLAKNSNEDYIIKK